MSYVKNELSVYIFCLETGSKKHKTAIPVWITRTSFTHLSGNANHRYKGTTYHASILNKRFYSPGRIGPTLPIAIERAAGIAEGFGLES